MKKLNSKGFTHHLLIFALLALVVGAAGFAGYRVYQSRNIDATAFNFKDMYTTSQKTVWVSGCVSTVNNYATIRAYAKNTGSLKAKWRVNVNTKGGGTSFAIGGEVKPYSTTNIYNKSFTFTRGRTVAYASVNDSPSSGAGTYIIGDKASSLRSC